MALAFIRKVPRSASEWTNFHFQHYIEHKEILAVVASKVGEVLLMPLIWPVPGNVYDARLAEFHQNLHLQMNYLSGSPTSDMTQVDLSNPDSATSFINTNYRDHLIFHQYVGVPV